jgi:hypothetical protein
MGHLSGCVCEFHRFDQYLLELKTILVTSQTFEDEHGPVEKDLLVFYLNALILGSNSYAPAA